MTVSLKPANLQSFSLAFAAGSYRVTDEALTPETGVWPIFFPLIVFFALIKGT